MKLAVGIIAWQDGHEMIEKTLASLEGIADKILIADGRIATIDSHGLEDTSDLEWLRETYAGAPVHIAAHVWPTQSAKRAWLLQKAQALGCDWLLQIDSDERLHQAAKLPGYLTTWASDAFPIPFEVDPGKVLGASWKVLRCAAWVRQVAGGAYIEHANGIVYCVVPPAGGPVENHELMPWLSHHPEERPAGRRQIRLGVLEDELEPPPDVPCWQTPGLQARPLLQPSATPSARTGAPIMDEPVYYCDQCGARYAGPGVCEQGHPPAEVQPVPADDPAADPAAAAVSEPAPPLPVSDTVAEVTAAAATLDPPAVPLQPETDAAANGNGTLTTGGGDLSGIAAAAQQLAIDLAKVAAALATHTG